MKIITGQDLRRVRMLTGMTQKEMSKKFKMTRGGYACLESRYRNKPLPKNKKEGLLMLEYSFVPMPPKQLGVLKRIIMWIKNLIRRHKNEM